MAYVSAMPLDRGGEELTSLMEKKDLEWLSPPEPYWRLEAPSLLREALRFGATPYDIRFMKVIQEVLRAYPGAMITHMAPPDGLKGDWKPAELSSEGWKAAEAGAAVRAFADGGEFAVPDANHGAWAGAWVVPSDFDPAELEGWLSVGAWAIWKPSEKSKGSGGMPRILAEPALKTVKEQSYLVLLTSSFENAFSELALHPELDA